MKMNYEELKTANATPAAASMVETFRAMGYSLETAMADILDNSISAGANNIWISRIWKGGQSIITIKDDGIGMNHQDLIEAMKDVDLPFKTIEELRDIAYSIAGEPQKVQFGDRVVGVIESRDGTIMDVVRQIKPFEFDD